MYRTKCGNMLFIALFFYISSILLGISLVAYFLDKKIDETLVKYAFSFPVGFSIATFIVLITDFLSGGFNDNFVLLSSVIMIGIAYYFYKKSSNAKMFKIKILTKQIKTQKLFYALLFCLIAVLIILQIYGVHNSPSGILGGDNYGTDFLFHISIGNSLIYSGWPPKLSYANYATNVFPFISDFYMSILIFNGISPVTALYLMNLILYFSLAVSAVYFIRIITKHKIAAVFGVVLFLFCSVGVNMLLIYIFQINLPYFSYSQLAGMGNNPIQLITFQLLNFADPIENNFAPQHDYVLGFPLAILVLSLIYLEIFDNKKLLSLNGVSRPFIFAAIITGLMPLIHPFSLIFIFIFGMTAFVYSMFMKNRKNIFKYLWLPFGIISFAIAAPQLFFIHSGDISSSFSGSVLSLQFWYNSSFVTSIILHILFWFEVIGPILIIGILGLYFFRKRLIIFLPVFIALAILNIIRFSPNFGDSNKIILYFLLFMSISAMELFYVMWKKGLLFKVIVIFAFVITIFGGILGEYYDLFGAYPIASNVEIAAASFILNYTQPSNTFVDSCYNSVFGLTSSLGGRRTLMEFENYINLVGIDNYNTQSIDYQTRSFLMDPTCSFVQKYNISYIALENLSTFSSTWCEPVNYTAFSRSNSFELFMGFNESSMTNNILIYKPICKNNTK